MFYPNGIVASQPVVGTKYTGKLTSPLLDEDALGVPNKSEALFCVGFLPGRRALLPLEAQATVRRV